MKNKAPKLRFPEFSGDWEENRFQNVFKIFNGYAFSSNDSRSNGIRWVKIADVGIKKMKEDSLSFLPFDYNKKYSNFLLNENDYVLALTRPILNNKLKIAKINSNFHNSLLNQRVGKLESNQNVDFIYHFLQKNNVVSKIETNIAGSDPPNLSPKEINNLKINIPSLPEQEKIASFLSEVDIKIEKLEKKKELLSQYKKGMMQKLFSQKLRFKDENGNDYPDWEEKKLEEILFEHKEKNKEGKILEVFSVARQKGVINQIEHLGRSFASNNTSNYKVIFENDIVYTKSPTSDFPFGIIKQNMTSRVGIVSTLYAVYKPINKYIGFILDSYFSSPINTYNYLNPLVQKGAKNTMNISNLEFLNGVKIKLPINVKEQEKIANFLSSIDKKIELVERELERNKEFKNGLLQKMFV
ncbi:MAG: restriction endonuclease subunit S [Cetobacterium sp.]